MASTINASTSAGLISTGDTSGVLALQTNSGTTAITVDTSQRVGIGTTSPTSTYRTSIKGDYSSIIGGVEFDNGGGDKMAVSFANATSPSFIFANQSSTGVLRFDTNATERMRIDSSGNLLVGTTSSIGGLLQINQTANSSGANFQCTNASFTTQVIQAITTKAAGTDFTLFRGVVNNSSSVVFNVFGNGNVTNTNGSYAAISDIKLKENITDATPKLADLMQVKVRNYNLKSDPSFKQIGVIAQELETIFPALVEETKDSDVDGNDLGTTTKAVKYSIFVPMLIKAIQEQQALITAQAETINALTARIVALEGR